MSDGVSKYNTAEADAATKVIESFIRAGVHPDDIGMVTPYASQVRVLKRLLQRDVEVSSVDGFQGREKEIIVISTVRSSYGGGIGFLADWRRMNVAFTRAKRGLVVIGNATTLKRDTKTWGPWLQWVSAHGVNVAEMGARYGLVNREELRRSGQLLRRQPIPLSAKNVSSTPVNLSTVKMAKSTQKVKDDDTDWWHED